MDEEYQKRKEWIQKNLEPEKIRHGRLYINKIKFEHLKDKIDPNKVERIKESLSFHGHNVLSVAVRPITTKDNAEKEYEIIYGEEWCFAARELNLSQLWVWVYEIDSVQSENVRTDIELLVSGEVSVPDINSRLLSEFNQIKSMVLDIHSKLEGKKITILDEINVNDSSLGVDELSKKIKGIGPKTAVKIIAYRDKNGQITDLSELESILGKRYFKPDDWQAQGLVCKPVQ